MSSRPLATSLLETHPHSPVAPSSRFAVASPDDFPKGSRTALGEADGLGAAAPPPGAPIRGADGPLLTQRRLLFIATRGSDGNRYGGC